MGSGVFIVHSSMYLDSYSEGGIPVAQVGGQAVEPVGEGPHHWREDEGPRPESTNHEAASQAAPVREPVQQGLPSQ